jgi:hypothetical protein
VRAQGNPLITSRFKDPQLNSFWKPDSVLSVKSQSWEANYADKNIADNPVIPTVADLLIGPDRCALRVLSCVMRFVLLSSRATC